MIIYQYPFREPYKITCPFGKKGTSWKCGYHSGLDLVSVAAGGDGLVHPVAAGTVLKTGYSAAYGNYVSVQHPDGYLSLYAHLTFCLAAAGTLVTCDSALGYEGATGNAVGRHLHLELHKGDYVYPAVIDPEAFLTEKMEKNTMSTYCELPLIHAVAIPPARLKVLSWKKGKRTSSIKNYACFPFQASGTVPVGNVIANGVKLSANPDLTTLWVDDTGAVGFGKTPPEGAREAVSGFPLIADEKEYTLEEVLSEGWDTSPLYATTHSVLGYGYDGLIHYYVFTSAKSGAQASFAEILGIVRQLGLRYALLGDGGGSTILDVGGENKIASEGSRQLAALIKF